MGLAGAAQGKDEAVRAVVVADTHLRSGIDRLPAPARALMESADVVLHAGDVVTASALEAMASLAPLHAVLGNNDAELVGRLDLTAVLDLAGVRVGMVHDSGPRKGRPGRLRRLFPDAGVVVFGHSHIPCNEVNDDGLLLFNPGSPTQRRRQPQPTVGILELADGQVVSHQVHPVAG